VRLVEERTGERLALPMRQCLYAPGYLVLGLRREPGKPLPDNMPFRRRQLRGLGELTAAGITALAARPVGTCCRHGTHALVDVSIDDL
jgi:hypothetical protein